MIILLTHNKAFGVFSLVIMPIERPIFPNKLLTSKVESDIEFPKLVKMITPISKTKR